MFLTTLSIKPLLVSYMRVRPLPPSRSTTEAQRLGQLLGHHVALLGARHVGEADAAQSLAKRLEIGASPPVGWYTNAIDDAVMLIPRSCSSSRESM